MTVYVDDMRRAARVGFLTATWSHLTADTREELLAFARRIGLWDDWRQAWDTHRYHYDVTEARRAAAVAAGAVEISYLRDMPDLLARRKAAEAGAGPRPHPKGLCSVCGKMISIRWNGMMREHGPPARRCDGSGAVIW